MNTEGRSGKGFGSPRPVPGTAVRRPLRQFAAAVLLATSVFAWNSLAHDIDVNQARKLVEQYSLPVALNGNFYQNRDINCRKLFPHQVRCRVSYKRTTNIPRQDCVEDITVYFLSHMGSRRDWTYYATHVNPATRCGFTLLTGPRP